MLKIVALYLCLTIFLVSGKGNKDVAASIHDSTQIASVVVPPKVAGQSIPKTLNGVDSPEPPRSTIKPETTTLNPETTTEIVTTTPAPKTTTPAPKTTTPAPETTTPAPETTTPAPITTTVSPVTTPAPAPKVGEWFVNGTNETCIVIKMAVQFNVSYTTSDNKTAWQELTLPTDNSTVATGSCGAKVQIFNLTWHAGEDSLMMNFTKNDTTDQYSMHHVEVSLGAHEFPNIKPNTTVKFIHETDQFPTKLSSSYRCIRLQKLDLTRNGTNQTGWLEITDLQFQAFKSDKTTNFGLVQDCQSDVPDIVPIAVGCALTILVIIVLVAYLVGRRRSQARGYLSM